jgi:hypothetical protein
MDLQKRNAELVDQLKTDFVGRNEPNVAWGNAISNFLMLPGLRGFWPLSTYDQNGDTYDLSGQGRKLSYNGNPVYQNTGLIPWLSLDGTGDYLSRADEASLDITGLETMVSIAGLTLGGWYNFTNLARAEGGISKWVTAANNSYALYKSVANVLNFIITNDGSTQIFVSSSVSATANKWLYWVGRYVPSIELAVWVNSTKTVNTTAIPASIFSGTSPLTIGTGPDMAGKISLQFLCASALSDAVINSLFHQTRALFGV